MTILELIISIIQVATSALAPFLNGNKTAAEVAALAQALTKIAQAAAQAYQTVTGQPIDLNVLQPIDPVPDPIIGNNAKLGAQATTGFAAAQGNVATAQGKAATLKCPTCSRPVPLGSTTPILD